MIKIPKILVDKDIFKEFLETASMEGIFQFRDGKGVRKPLFSSFYIRANKENDTLEILTTDSISKKTDANFILHEVEVLEANEDDEIIPITDYETIAKCLKGSGIVGKIRIYNEGQILFLESDTDIYEIAQKDNSDIARMEDNDILNRLDIWRGEHRFDGENNSLVMHVDREEIGQIDVPYTTRIVVKKDDLMKVVGDKINITKDNETKFVLKGGNFYAMAGAGNAAVKSKHKIPFEDLSEDLGEFEEEFYNVQIIIPNLFDEIEINIRRVKANNTIALWIRSIKCKETGKLKIPLIEANIAITSIIED